MCNLINSHTHTHTWYPPWEDKCESHRMARITGPDCAVMCSLINTHTHSQPYSPSRNQIHLTCPLCLREKTYQGTVVSVAVHQREAHPGEGNGLLEKLGRPLQKTRRSNRYGVCYKCGDLQRTSADTRVDAIEHPQTTYPRILMDWVASPLREIQTRPLTPAADIFNQGEQSSPSILLPGGIEDVGPTLDALDGTTFARMSLSTAKAVRQEHRMPFARSLKHALRIFCQAHMLYR